MIKIKTKQGDTKDMKIITVTKIPTTNLIYIQCDSPNNIIVRMTLEDLKAIEVIVNKQS
jgi:hypothetical protein